MNLIVFTRSRLDCGSLLMSSVIDRPASMRVAVKLFYFGIDITSVNDFCPLMQLSPLIRQLVLILTTVYFV
jgi:hypothetical protein